MLQLVQHRDVEALLNQGLEWLGGTEGETKGAGEGGGEGEGEGVGEGEGEVKGEGVGVGEGEGEGEGVGESEGEEKGEGEGREAKAEDSFSNEIRSALKNRLLLARAMLADFSKDWDSYHSGAKPGWTGTLRYLDEVEKSHKLGKDAREAWSVSVLRKLASPVPPRPLIDLPFGDAVAALRQLCTDTQDIFKILDYAGAQNLMVGAFALAPGGVLNRPV